MQTPTLDQQEQMVNNHLPPYPTPSPIDVLKDNIEYSKKLLAKFLREDNTELVAYHTEQLRRMKYNLSLLTDKEN